MTDFAERIAGLSPEKRALLLRRLAQNQSSATHNTITRQPREVDTFPLSFAQQRLWFLDQLMPGSPLYNEPIAIRLRGELDVALLESSLAEVVRRHEVLRTTFVQDDNTDTPAEPTQRIAAASTVPLVIDDLTTLPNQHHDDEVRRLALHESRQPFNLRQGPLLRARLLRLSATEHVLLLTMHHIVTDAWSMGVLLRDVGAIYAAFSRGEPSPLSELLVQYVDYTVWQREWLQGKTLQTQLDYWKRQLGGNPPMLELPTDYRRPSIQRFEGARHRFTLPARLVEAVKALSAHEGATLFMALLAAFQVLLHRYSGQYDISVGSPVANRNRAETEELVGFFVNTLVLRTNLAGNPSFRQVLASVREVALDAFAHQDLPFEKLVEELHPQRDLNRTPLFQVMFALPTVSLQNLNLDKLTMEPLMIDNGTAKFDLLLHLWEMPEGLTGWLEYSTDLFTGETVARMAQHFQILLEGIVADPDCRLGELTLLDAEEQHLLHLWNHTAYQWNQPVCLHQLIEAQVARTPNTLAVIGDTQLTYAELNERANQLAHYLRQLGVKAEDLVAVCADRSAELVVSLLAVLKAGAAYVPLDPNYPHDRLQFMLHDSGATVLLTEERMRQELGLKRHAPGEEHQAPFIPQAHQRPGRPELQVISLDIDWQHIAHQSRENVPNRVGGDNLAYVIYTSGSTGKPKGAMNTHRAICNRLLWMQAEYQLTPADRVLQKTPVSFDVSVWEFFWPLLTGAGLVLARPGGHQDPAYLVELIVEQQVTTLHFVPPMLQVFLQEPNVGNCTTLRHVICSGEALPFDLQQRFFERLAAQLHNLYGPTEAAVDVTFWACERDSQRPTVPIGRPISNVATRLLDSYGNEVPIGTPGELHIAGVGLGRGYLRRPELTAERFVPDPWSAEPGARLYRTGDLARYRPDGAIEFLGRLDFQVKIRGFRIELGEIEATLAEHAAVREVIVLAEETVHGPRLVAYLVGASQGVPTASELRRFLERTLPDYMVPSAFVLLEAMPLTPNGKIDRHLLPTLVQDNGSDSDDYIAPRNPVEEIIAGIWVEVLGRERVSIYDNFFHLGGHSLLATQVASRLRNVFQFNVPLRALFEAPTVAGLAEVVVGYQREQASGADIATTRADGSSYQEGGALLAGTLDEAQRPPLKSLPRDGVLPLSFAQQRLWFLDQLQPGSSFYNMPLALRMEGQLDVEALEQALVGVVQRHEVLRTTFPTVDGQPSQHIAASAQAPLALVDLHHLSSEEREIIARQHMESEALQPFDLSTGPLLRATLLRLTDTQHILLLTLHHIIADGWSLGVLVRELAALYTAGNNALPLLPIQYADYAVWQREWLEGPVLDTQLAYWRQQLAGVAPLQLPTDHARPAVQSFRGAQHSVLLPPALGDGLAALSRQAGTTVFMTLLAAWQVLLHRYSGQTDIVVGTPIANRTNTDIEGLIGFFVNTLVLRSDLAGNPTFRKVLSQIRQVAMGAYAHQDLPFERLVEELQPARDLSRQPLFQVMFALQNAPLQIVDLAGLQLQPVEIHNGTVKFDLALDMWETPAGLRGIWMYNTDLFDNATIERMAGHFQTLVAGIVANPDQLIAELPLLTSAEQQEILVSWNSTQAKFPQRFVHQLWEDQVERSPDAVAVVFESQQITYHELNSRANQLAHYLRRIGAGPEVPVALCVERSPALIVGILAILKAGGAYVPLDPEHPADRLQWMLTDSRAPVLVTEQHLRPRLSTYTGEVVVLDADEAQIAEEPIQNLPHEAAANNLAYLIYTSGTTGRPKAVMVEHHNLANTLFTSQKHFDFRAGDVMPWIASFAFDIALFELFNPLLAGGSVVCLTRQHVLDTAVLAQTLEACTVVHTVPSLMRQIVNFVREPGHGPSYFNTIRTVFIGGDIVPPRLLSEMREVFPLAEIYVLYGPTEASIICARYPVPVDQIPDKHLIGTPLNNATLRIYDEHRQILPIGVPGELYIGGAGVARGYLNQEQLTYEKFVEIDGQRFYRSGDLARFQPDGTIEFLGRIDQQVKLRGFRVELGEIETVLNQQAGVRENVVVVRSDQIDDHRLVAYIVPDRLAADVADQTAVHRWHTEQIDRWQMIFDATHQENTPLSDATFNIVGWNSSYTGNPLPEGDMRTWVNQTVARIAALQPRRVLEIGCGTGLLLFQIAPFCEYYLGTDFAAAPLRQVQQQLHDRSLRHVSLLQRSADDWDGIPPGAFDTVILNSVAQYFPSVEYFVRVLERAVERVAPGGRLFIGDLRSLPLLETFHTSVQLFQTADDAAVAQVRQQVRRHMADDEELVVDPGFFTALAAHIPRISQVELQLKRGYEHNELTKFRYDVVLYIEMAREPTREIMWIPWQEGQVTIPALLERLNRDAPDLLGLRGVPNARLEADFKATALLADPGGPRTAGEVRLAVSAAQRTGIEPEDLWSLEQDGRYTVTIFWGQTPETIDVVLRRRSSEGGDVSIADNTPTVSANQLWHMYANDPLRARFGHTLVPQLRSRLKEQLPDYMVPSAFVVLDRLPLTPNDKVDRQALPAPDVYRPELEKTYVAPRTPIEELLAAICAEMLGLERVGVNDNFFDLGGHSLLATQVVSRVRDTFQLDVPLRALFEAPTVAGLAETIVEYQIEQASAADIAATWDELSELSDEEVEALLASEMNQMRQPPS